jgi:PAS domain S-box-containing protein
MVGITRDITKDKEWENLQESLIQEIEKERDLLNIIMENSNTNLAYLDKDFNFINANSFFVQSCGISKDKLIDNNFFDFFPSNENKAIFKKVIRNRKKVEFEAKHFKFQKDKDAKYWNWSLIPISNKKGTIKGLVLSLQDVTDIKKNEQYVKNLNDALMRKTTDLALSNQELEAFTYSASHDLQAPLRSISGFSEILLEDYLDSLDEEGKDYLKRIEKATDMMSQLINDLLKLSQVSRTDINRQEVDIDKLAYNSLNTLRTKDPLRSVKVEIQSNLKTEGDKNLLQIAIDNLIRNAWKFTKNKKHAKIEIGKTEKNGKQTYYIRDNGIGFDEKFKKKLFIPFQRFHDEKEYPGSGIGLPLVARIIHRHNGEIWAESSPKKETTFYFTLGK